MQTNIIGISPGTWQLAIAVYRKGRLVDWRMKSFKGRWSEKKLATITKSLEAILLGHQISHMAFKLPQTQESSKAMFSIIDTLTKLAEKHHIPVIGFDIRQIKRGYKSHDVRNKKELMQVILEQQPEMKHEYEKEQKNHGYYIKLFEAVACAQLLLQKLEEK